MNSRKRIFTAANLLLRDDGGKINEDAISIFESQYCIARNEKLSVQASAEIAMRKALGG